MLKEEEKEKEKGEKRFAFGFRLCRSRGRKRGKRNVVSNWLENYWAKECAEGVRRDYISGIDGGAKFNFRESHTASFRPFAWNIFPLIAFFLSLSLSHLLLPSRVSRLARRWRRKWRGNWSGKISLAISPLKALNLIFHVYRVSKLLSLHSDSVHNLHQDPFGSWLRREKLKNNDGERGRRKKMIISLQFSANWKFPVLSPSPSAHLSLHRRREGNCARKGRKPLLEPLNTQAIESSPLLRRCWNKEVKLLKIHWIKLLGNSASFALHQNFVPQQTRSHAIASPLL